jgi:diadenosine tetraphosphate (Ap4A) HIT family hydrolase
MPILTTSSTPTNRLEAGEAPCHFCAQFTAPSDKDMSQAVLFESPRFVVWPSVGALIPGWLLIVPRRHTLTLAEMSDAELDELAMLRSQVRASLDPLGPVVCFEHGPCASGQEVGCGVDHAHLHLVPTEAEILAGAQRLFAPLSWRSIDSLAKGREALDTDESYLYVQDQKGREWLASHAEIPSQLIRKVIASHLGRPKDYNWRTHPEEPNVKKTVDIFSRS